MASISTPVCAVVAALALMTSTPALRSGVISTVTSLRVSGWQSGMSSAVRLAAMMPASSATLMTSPLGPEPSMTSVSVSWSIFTVASATARRAVTGFSLTSTMRGRPSRSTWLSRRRSWRLGAAGAGVGPATPHETSTSSLMTSTSAPAASSATPSGTTASPSAAARAERT